MKFRFSKLSAPFKTQKAAAAFKIFMLGSYCTLICAAVLFSFKSVFYLFAG